MSRFLHAVFSLAVGLLALSASLFHLGRPQYAFRAVLGIRHSWLSREILGFGLFAKLALAYAAWLGLGMLRPELLPANARHIELWFGPSVAFVGLSAVFCSAMLYHATRRQLWSLSRSGPLFFLTSAVLGFASTIAIATAGAFTFGAQDSSTASVAVLCQALVLCSVVKLGFELSLLTHLREKRQSELKRTALLLVGELAPWFKARVVFGLFGGVLAPYALLSSQVDGFGALELTCAILTLLSTLAGELCERRLYFASVSAPRMPGGLR
jgi:DMSO reductase anchor subunit